MGLGKQSYCWDHGQAERGPLWGGGLSLQGQGLLGFYQGRYLFLKKGNVEVLGPIVSVSRHLEKPGRGKTSGPSVRRRSPQLSPTAAKK